MSWEQNIVDAQVCVNRCVWAQNENPEYGSKAFKSVEERNKYIKQEAREAIITLSQALVELDNQLNFKP